MNRSWICALASNSTEECRLALLPLKTIDAESQLPRLFKSICRSDGEKSPNGSYLIKRSIVGQLPATANGF